MQLLLDTCALKDIFNIEKVEKIDLFSILNRFRIGYTDELEKEYLNYGFDSKKINYIFKVLISEQERQDYISKFNLETLDPADQDLFITGIRDGSMVISNDRDLILQCQAYNIEAYYLWSFLSNLVTMELMKKNTYYKCYHYWDVKKRFDKKTLNRIKKIFHNL